MMGAGAPAAAGGPRPNRNWQRPANRAAASSFHEKEKRERKERKENVYGKSEVNGFPATDRS